MHPENVLETELVFDDFERKHIVQTLRKNTGDRLMVTDGQGTLYSGVIIETNPELKIKILSQEKKAQQRPQLILGCGFIKQNRMDFILEKGTELSVNTFHFFRSRYANYFSTNTKRYQKIVRQALKQSLHVYLPQIRVHAGMDDFLAELPSHQPRFIAVDSTYPDFSQVLQNTMTKNADTVTVVIGPEGGFAEEEIQRFLSRGFHGFSLGNYRLRTETAAIAAISIVKQYIN